MSVSRTVAALVGRVPVGFVETIAIPQAEAVQSTVVAAIATALEQLAAELRANPAVIAIDKVQMQMAPAIPRQTGASFQVSILLTEPSA